MSYRLPARELIDSQAELVQLLRELKGAQNGRWKTILDLEPHFQALQEKIAADEDERWLNRVSSLFSLLTASFHLARWAHGQTTAELGSDRFLIAAKANAQQAATNSGTLDPGRPSLATLTAVAEEIKALSDIHQVPGVLEAISRLSFSLKLSEPHKPFPRGTKTFEDSGNEQDRPVILSVLFSLQGEPWANPQVVKPGQLFKISGKLKVNYWPVGYTLLNLFPVSTTDDSWYTLSLPPVAAGTSEEVAIEGVISFPHPQADFDESWSIKLWAELTGQDKISLYPRIVGYDQLKVKVLSEASFPALSRYPILNQKIIKILTEIDQVMPTLSKADRDDFIPFSCAIFNYQGYCAEQGEYKGVSNLTEAEFRNNLIRFLSADPRLTSPIIKEGEIAGGKVEINYKGIVAELKVERTVKDRQKVIEAHFKQAAAYATATGKRLSILCVLDMTTKTNPSATTANNVFLVEPPYHGFESTPPDEPSRVVAVFIDGNLVRPSDLK